LIFARKEETHNFTNLWELPVNTATGKWEGAPRQLTEWSNFSVSQLSSSADGKRVAFLNGGWRADVMTGDLKTSREGMQLLNTRRLTLGRGDDAPAFWTADDQAVVFESDRNGRSQIFRQRLDQTAAELLSMDSGETQGLHFGGAWIYYHSLPAGGNMLWDQPVAVRRIPIRGGASSEVMKGVGLEIDCSLSRPEICVVGQLENKILTFYRFDHEKGRGAEVGRLPYDSRRSPSFAVSPDGSEVAAIDPKGSGNWIRRIPFNGGPSSEVELRGRKELTALYWAPDGKGWVAASTTPNNGEYLLHVDLHGDSQILYEQREDGRDTWGIPSHNGKQLAFLRWIAPKDVWMIDNF
jgi:dipeptidyl aminopeptidase/acylaminoacyl peptidase